MMRIVYIGTLVILLATAYLFMVRMGVDPVAPSRAWLEKELANVPKAVALSSEEKADFSEWQIVVANNPKVWDALTPPPPPPKVYVKPPPPPKKPDMKKLLTHVKAGTAQIGDKVSFPQIPGETGKQWLKVGTVIQGCTFKSFDREFVYFELNWVQGKKLLKHKIPRQ